ncbi:ABC transporter ATP-binding protein [Armatimonas rosea]|uniref:ABC-type nitrate/sulfonate/bicarbonate transport system ATPase subunit n=1 Tax=Armatimonas rosea TaxID=685828 RepID=A0A7W9SSG2_ARMRO|nr:ABC transporter ATP-binding protein [Armatimonas rosea]MBB6051339.1 ABC-type nitrate/sulfonate/bicarbonate transport system ATPase subunit [Armatimonas rosea]
MIRLERVTLRYGTTEVLSEVSLEVTKGEFVAIVGPSGAGKTTLLNLFSGAIEPSGGSIRRAGKTRMVYQADGLLPWLTVQKNIALGVRELPVEERGPRVTALLSLVGLTEFASHFPRQLSGGMRQRAELARALAGETDVLLLDEPFSALDYLTRLKLRAELARLLSERPCTTILVTHDIEEAAQLADRVLVLSERPATIQQELVLTTPRPREVTQPEVVEAIHTILAALGVE